VVAMHAEWGTTGPTRSSSEPKERLSAEIVEKSYTQLESYCRSIVKEQCHEVAARLEARLEELVHAAPSPHSGIACALNPPGEGSHTHMPRPASAEAFAVRGAPGARTGSASACSPSGCSVNVVGGAGTAFTVVRPVLGCASPAVPQKLMPEGFPVMPGAQEVAAQANSSSVPIASAASAMHPAPQFACSKGAAASSAPVMRPMSHSISARVLPPPSATSPTMFATAPIGCSATTAACLAPVVTQAPGGVGGNAIGMTACASSERLPASQRRSRSVEPKVVSMADSKATVLPPRCQAHAPAGRGCNALLAGGFGCGSVTAAPGSPYATLPPAPVSMRLLSGMRSPASPTRPCSGIATPSQASPGAAVADGRPTPSSASPGVSASDRAMANNREGGITHL